MEAALKILLLIVTAQASIFNENDESESTRGLKPNGRGPATSMWDCTNVTPVPPNVRDEFALDPFYHKYTQAYGIPILSSKKPEDAALIRACYVVRFMLADREDIRDAMHDRYARVSVIGEDEKTNGIPEYRHLSNFWNERARGLGGTIRIPVTTDGEEDLLCKDGWTDRWYEEDVLVHEFSHAIYYIGLGIADPSFAQRLGDIFKAAKKNNLWEHTYAGTSSSEYFAEGVQSFFNVEAHRDFIDNVHNNISTREALYSYDRPLYDLIVDVFPCKNTVVNRCDEQELAASQELEKNCK